MCPCSINPFCERPSTKSHVMIMTSQLSKMETESERETKQVLLKQLQHLSLLCLKFAQYTQDVPILMLQFFLILRYFCFSLFPMMENCPCPRAPCSCG